MNTTLHHSSTHPPDTEDRTVLRIPAPNDLRELALADRLSLKIGVWLLERAQRPKAVRERSSDAVEPLFLSDRNLTASEAHIVLGYHMQRQLL